MKVCPQCKQEYPAEVDFCPTDGTKLRNQREETDDPLIGVALDRRWVIEEKLGEGGMGAVYRGHQKSVDRTVAIKTLRPQLVDSEEFVDRFFREARIAATISHPNSVTILDYGESDDGTLYLAMEFLDGELLTDRIEAGTLTIKQVLEIAIQVSSALSAAHDNQIVHRDLKPDNIFLLDVPGGATFVKVLDFGIAKMLDSKTQVTKTGMIFGTPEYMSPEQCRGDKIDGRSDLYSLGCIMYELVGGRTPFRATTPMAVLMAHVNQAAPALAAKGTGAHIPFEVEQIIMRLLEKNPDNRFENADELRKTLERVLHALENPGSTASRELVRPVPSREIVADEVNIGFDNTVGIDTGSGVAVAAEPRRERPQTDAINPHRSKAPLIVLAVLLVGVVGAVGALALSLTGEENVEPVVEDQIERPGAEVEAEPVVAAVDPEPPLEVEPPTEPTEPAAQTEPEPEPEAQAAAKKPTSKKRAAKKAEPEPEPQPEPEPEPKPEPEVKPEPKPEPEAKAEAPKPREKEKKKGIKGLKTKIDKKVEDEVDNAGKEIKKGYENIMDGLMN